MRKSTYIAVALGAFFGCAAQAYDIEFGQSSWSINGENVSGYSTSVPEGWMLNKTGTSLTIASDRSGKSGVSALNFTFYSAAKSQTASLKMGSGLSIPKSLIVCDNVAATLSVYLYPSNGKSPDTFQIVGTTNSWESSFDIGVPVPVRDSSYEEGWKDVTVVTTINGISQTDSYDDFQIGIIATAGGVSKTYGYLHGVSVKFVVCATPEAPFLVSTTEESTDVNMVLTDSIAPGVEYGRMASRVDVSPADKIDDLEVWGVLTRDNLPAITNRLIYSETDGIYYESEAEARSRPRFDAGETVRCSVFTKYKSTEEAISTLGDVADDGFGYEYSEQSEYTGGKLASAWINEFAFENGQCWIEICGTTNRTYLPGWYVVLRGEETSYTNTLAGTFLFEESNMYNGVVGIETRRLSLFDSLNMSGATLQLINPAGIVESSFANVDVPGNYRMEGVARWNEDEGFEYDWAGTGLSSNGPFSPVRFYDEPTLGSVNKPVQGFIVPVAATLHITALIEDSGFALPYAGITTTVAGILNGVPGVKTFTGQTSEELGCASIQISGFSDDASQVAITNTISAFAWKSADTNLIVSLYEDIYVTNLVESTVACDDFSELKDYWSAESTIKYSGKEVNWNTTGEGILQLNTLSSISGEAMLTSKGYMDLRGKRCIDITFSFRNEKTTINPSRMDTVEMILGDSADFSGDTIVKTVGLKNKESSYHNDEWYHFRQFFELPSTFALDNKIWIRIKSISTGSTGVYSTLDNLRVAAVDSVKAESLSLQPPVDSFTMTDSGGLVPLELTEAATLDLSPLTAGVVTGYVARVTGYTVTTNEVAAGTFATLEAYEDFLADVQSEAELLGDEIAVSTTTNITYDVTGVTTNSVKSVAADLMLSINGVEYEIPFSFGTDERGEPIYTNDVSCLRNNLTLSLDPSVITQATGGFLPGDSVSYYARISYDPDDADESESRDYRYIPDNAVATETGWYAKGLGWNTENANLDAYTPGYRTFSFTGANLSVVKSPDYEITSTGISGLKYHAWDDAGITSLAVSVNGTIVQQFDWNDSDAPSRLTYMFNSADVDYSFQPNTEYTLTITGYARSSSSPLTPATYTFMTRPATPTLAFGRTEPYGLTLAVSGDAASFEVSPSTWTPSGDGRTWTLSGEANAEYSATVYAVNSRGDKSASPAVGSAYTYAAVPSGAPLVNKDSATATATVGAGDGYATAGGGNAADTEYAVRITTTTDDSVRYVTNGTDVVWKTLEAWHETPETVAAPTIDLEATNLFAFVSRNAENFETPTAGPATECWFDMTAAFVADGFGQVADPFGTVKYSLALTDPAQGENATATVEYSFDNGASWTQCDTFAVDFNVIAVTSPVRSWDARAATGAVDGTYPFKLRARVTSGARSSQWAEISGTLDFVKPTVGLESNTPNPFNDTATFTVAVTFAEPVTGFAKEFVAVVNGTATSVTGSGAAYTVTIAPAGDGNVEVGIPAAVAVDAMGNGNTASATLVRRYDVTLPTVEIESATSAVFGGAAAPLTATVAFSEPVSGFSASSVTVENGTVASVAESTDIDNAYVVAVTPSGDGAVTLKVEADKVVDDAGNGNAQSATLTRVYDTMPPTVPAVAGAPANPTNVKAFSLTASSDDANAVTYHWTFGGVDAVTTGDDAFAGSAQADGAYSVSVYAEDAAGNASEAATVSWTYDATKPKVTGIASATPDPFNASEAFSVAITFSEPVTGFSAASVGVQNGTVSSFIGSGASYTVTITPGNDGNVTVSVLANVVKDAAGNDNEASAADLALTRRFDKTRPTVSLATAEASPSRSDSFAVTATFSEAVTGFTADSLTKVNCTVTDIATTDNTVFAFTVSPTEDGDVSVTVTADAVKDSARNGNAASDTLTIVSDRTKPVKPTIAGAPGALVSEPGYALSASATDNLSGIARYEWTLKIGDAEPVPSQGTALSGTGSADATYVATVVAVDNAGNRSESAAASWILDTTPPADLAISGTPVAGTVTNEYVFEFMASASDDVAAEYPELYPVKYYWTLNGVDVEGTAAQFADADAAVEGTNVVSVIAEDAAGNRCDAASVKWVVDTTDPGVPTITGGPLDQARTNATSFAMTAEADDATVLTYHWSLDGGAVSELAAGAAFNVQAGEAGPHSVSVYATDEAGNQGETATLSWTLDVTSPTVTLTSETPLYFKEGVAFTVTVVFDETVTDFSPSALHVSNGSVSGFTETAAGREYSVTIVPGDNGIVSLSVAANAVHDVAGNGNASSGTISRMYDTVAPTFTLDSNTHNPFNAENAPFVVTIKFDEVVHALTADALTVMNAKSVEVTGSGDAYTVSVTPDGDGEVSVAIEPGKVFDQAENANTASASIAKRYDNTKPTDPVISNKPGSLTNIKAFDMGATSEDASELVFSWTFNGAGSTGASLSGEAVEGENTVSVYATDAAGNVSETTSYTWFFDETPPHGLAIAGEPLNGVVTSNATVNLVASAADRDGTTVTYRWSFGENTFCGAEFATTLENDGPYAVSVVAIDEAGNESDPVTRTWTLDTQKPTGLAITGTPADSSYTNVKAFSFTAVAEDATTLTYYWTFGDSTVSKTEGAPFEGAISREGDYVVSVYAQDAAGNRSDPASVSWTYDETDPTVELASDTPANFNVDNSPLVVTVTFSEPVTNFTAASVAVVNGSIPVDGVVESESVDNAYVVTVNPAEDGDVSVQVLAGVVADAAGNGNTASGTLARTFDTVAPKAIVSSTTADPFNANAAPMVVTFAFSEPVTGFGGDAITVDNGSVESVSESPTAENTYIVAVAPTTDGNVTVGVEAGKVLDLAGNVYTASASIAKRYDNTKPTDPVISNKPGSLTNIKAFDMGATSEDASELVFSWTFNGAGSTGASLSGEAVEGENTVSVYATDAAGNVSETTSYTWFFDETPPHGLAIAGEPLNGVVTSNATVNLVASAADRDGTTVTYRWSFGENTFCGAEFATTLENDGPYAVSVVAIDEAGNESDPATRTWTLDTQKPTGLAITGTPADNSFTNERSYSFTAGAHDATTLTYHWSFGGVETTGTTLAGSVEEETSYAASVYAEDAAGNRSDTIDVRWTYDATRPNVTLSSDTPDPFCATNEFKVTVAFDELVTDFTEETVASAMTVVNGSVKSFAVSPDVDNGYIVVIEPVEGEVSVAIDTDKVHDRAGNGNAASEVLSRVCDLTPPTVTLTSSTRNVFNSGETFTVDVAFSEDVEGFAKDYLTVSNGSVVSVTGSGKTYLATITPDADGNVTVRIEADKVFDQAGNGNVASEPLTRVYDKTRPTDPVISGTPGNGSTVKNDTSFRLSATSADANGINYIWFLNGKQKSGVNGSVFEGSGVVGTNKVQVVAVDEALNQSLHRSEIWEWVVVEEATDVEFGGGVCVKVNPETGATNSVVFTALNFKPGETCTFTLSGFDSSTQEIPDFNMWFVVCDELGGELDYVKANPSATFDSDHGELTVSLPASATEGKDSFFILGIDNKGKE